MRGRRISLCIVNDNRIFRYFGTSLVYVDRMHRPARRWVFDETCSVRSIGLLAAFRIHRLITPAYRPIESQPAARRRVHATFRPKQVAPSAFSRRGLFPIVYLSASLIPRRFRGRHIFWGCLFCLLILGAVTAHECCVAVHAGTSCCFASVN